MMMMRDACTVIELFVFACLLRRMLRWIRPYQRQFSVRSVYLYLLLYPLMMETLVTSTD